MSRNRSRRGLLGIAIVAAVLAVFVLSPTEAQAAAYDLTTDNPTKSYDINGAIWERFQPADATGSGTFHSFLRIDASPTEKGFNSDYRPVQFDEDTSANYNRSILLSDVPQELIEGTLYREFQLDINEVKNDPKWYLSLDRFQVWVTDNRNITGYDYSTGQFVGGDAQLVYDLGNDTIKLDFRCNPGSGKRDYRVLIPEALFEGKTGEYVVLFVEHGQEYPSDDGFEEWGVKVAPKLTTVTTQLSATGLEVGDQVVDNAIITYSASALTPTGNVALWVKTPSNPVWTQIGTKAIPAGYLSGTLIPFDPYTATEVGQHWFQARYAGDTNFLGAQSGETDELLTVSKRNTEIATLLSCGNDGSVLVGESVTDKITLSWTAPSGIVPTGSIEVYVKAPGGDWALHETNDLTGLTTSPYEFTTTAKVLGVVGDYYFKAAYVPDAEAVFNGSSSGESAEKVTVSKRNTEIATLLSCGNDGSVLVGESVTDKITLSWTAPEGIVPTGSIKVYVKAPGEGWALHETKPLSGLTTSPYEFTTTAKVLGVVGDYYFKAAYVPDAEAVFNGSSSGESAEKVTVSKRNTEIATLLSCGNDGSVFVGESVTDKITLSWTAPSGIVPTGSIEVYVKAPGEGWALHETKPLSGLTTSPYEFTTTAKVLGVVGDYYFKAAYVPDAEAVFNGSSSGESAEKVTVSKRNTEIATLLSCGNDGSVLVGESVTDKITLSWTAPSGIVPTGSIEVYVKAPGGDWALHETNDLTGLTTSPYEFTTTAKLLDVVGDYYFKAVYVPDTGAVFNGSSSGDTDEHILVKQRCYSETAWAAENLPGQTRFVSTKGNWATYVKYDLTDACYTRDNPRVYPVYAGQTYYAGSLLVYHSDGTLYVKYVASQDNGGYKPGYIGAWKGLTEYHLHVVDEFSDFNSVRTKDKKTGYGNPIPGQFMYSGTFGEKQPYTDWIEVNITGFSGDIYIAAHAVMWWCGY